MKRLILFLLVVITAFVMASAVFAAEKTPLGKGNIAIKVGYINFTNDVLKDSDVDTGFYIGLEGYGEIAPKLYLGGEVGYANPSGSIDIEDIHADTEVTFIPIEVNLKYAIEAAPNLAIDFGAGVSYNYVREKATVSAFDFSSSASINDWLFGGQFFADLDFKFSQFFIGMNVCQFFIGINAKYQLTEDFQDFNYNYNNWRVGGQIGMIF